MAYSVFIIIYPNDKIYIASDTSEDVFRKKNNYLDYYGSSSNHKMTTDLLIDGGNGGDFTIRKVILFESKNKCEVLDMESFFIELFGSTNNEIGYNLKS